MTQLSDWPNVDRIIQGLIWIIIEMEAGEATAESICEAIAITDPTVPTDLIMYSIGTLAGQRRIVPTFPNEPLPEGAWALVKWKVSVE